MEAQCARARWNGGKHVFWLELSCNIKHTFGAAAFLVDEASSQVVSLDEYGCPLEPLTAGMPRRASACKEAHSE